jgi:hypothetical protein
MAEPQAVEFLKSPCVPADPADAALRAIWQGAQANLGAPVANAGAPNVTPIPAAQAPHIVTLMQTPTFQQFALQFPNTIFQMVEIDPLLAFQFSVDMDRSQSHCGALGNPPTADELMHCCLPIVVQPEPMQTRLQQQSLLIKARSLNLRIIAQGWFPQPNPPHAAGVFFGPSFPYVHVVRLNGRYYLHNGFHRTVGARRAGATHIPCVVREVTDELAAGIQKDGTTFSSALLNSANPPTVGHYCNGRATAVRLRQHSRIMHLTWAEYSVYDE